MKFFVVYPEKIVFYDCFATKNFCNDFRVVFYTRWLECPNCHSESYSDEE